MQEPRILVELESKVVGLLLGATVSRDVTLTATRPNAPQNFAIGVFFFIHFEVDVS